MSEYKSGGIAALFPKPKMPTTESGKKLQSLFKEFHNVKERKTFIKKNQEQRNKIEFLISKLPVGNNERADKNRSKKRKFSDHNTSISNFNAGSPSSKKQKLNIVKTEFQSAESQVNINTDSKARNEAFKRKPFPRKKVKPSMKKSFENDAFKSKSLFPVPSYVKPKFEYETNDFDFSKKCEDLSSDDETNESKLQQNSNSQSSILGVKNIFAEGDSEDFIRLPSVDNPEGKRERNDDNTIFVGNLPLTITRKDLRNLFCKYGEIAFVRITGIVPAKLHMPLNIAERKRNYHPSVKSLKAFIEFKDKQNALDALVLNGTFFKGNHIFVDRAASGKKLYDDKLSVFIGNLPFDVADEAVYAAFSHCGPIQCIRIVRDRLTGVSKGFGYVEFNSSKTKQKALNMEKLEIDGRTIRIKAIECKDGNQKMPVKQFDSFKSKAFNLKKKQEGNSASRKSVKKIRKQLKMSQKQKHVASFLLNSKRAK